MIIGKIGGNHKVFLRVFLETQILTLACVLLFFALRFFNLSPFLPLITTVEPLSVSQEINRENTLGTYVDYINKFSWIIVFVLIEEVSSRLIPFYFWEKYFIKWIPFAFLAILTAIIFAILHNTSFTTFHFPRVQFIAGLYYAYLYKLKNGFKYAVFSHVTYNVFSGYYIAAILELFFKSEK